MTKLRLADLDLQGYSLVERLNGIALMQDPTRADIVRFAAQHIERMERALYLANNAVEKLQDNLRERGARPHTHKPVAGCPACSIDETEEAADEAADLIQELFNCGNELPPGFILVPQCAGCGVQDRPDSRHTDTCPAYPGQKVRP